MVLAIVLCPVFMELFLQDNFQIQAFVRYGDHASKFCNELMQTFRQVSNLVILSLAPLKSANYWLVFSRCREDNRYQMIVGHVHVHNVVIYLCV